MDKNIKIIGLMKITKLQKKTEFRFDVTGILLQLVPFFWSIFKFLYCTNIAQHPRRNPWKLNDDKMPSVTIKDQVNEYKKLV